MIGSKIEENLKGVLNSFNPETFIYDLLSAYGKPKASINRLQNGDYNLSKNSDEILWKKNLFFKRVNEKELHSTFENVSHNEKIIKHDPRFIIVFDDQTILACDTKTSDILDIPINDLVENFNFFLPLTGRENVVFYKENPADIKAAEKMAKIYDEICKNNPGIELNNILELNVFLSRLLFCFFAESTQLFKQNLFSKTIGTRTKEDGSDLDQYFFTLFELLNTADSKRAGYPKYLDVFPYVNGGLFKVKYKIPRFSSKLRKMIIESGKMDWSSINPDIFGSMIQAVSHSDQRSNLGMHYTSVSNIMKVIQPLFLDDLYHEIEKNKKNKQKLNELYKRLSNIKIFDPACGSGNFLIIAYKELRKLEIQLLQYLERLGKHPSFLSRIQLSQFYGIEIDSFACEIAKLSLLLAEQQMNILFQNTFGKIGSSLPLKEGGYIVCGNATRLNWEEICPKDEKAETYVLGNPPYSGYSVQTKEQKKDLCHVLNNLKEFKSLDYIACWIMKGAEYIQRTNAKYAFVSTNSICQGEQVSLLWPEIFKKNLEIDFAYRSFKWSNHAKQNAGVSCIILGIRNKSNKDKILYQNETKIKCSNISPYLIPCKNITIVNKRNTTLSVLPKIGYGSSALDGGNLILSKQEMEGIIKENPEAMRFIKKIIGSQELLKGIERWCIWIDDDEFEQAQNINPILERIEKVKDFRRNSSRQSTINASIKPYKFGEARSVEGNVIIIPKVSSERRDYIPIGYFSSSVIVMDKAFPIYNPEPYVFSIVSSRMHMVWVQAVAGRLKTDPSYSSSICYNTFPFPNLTEKQKKMMEKHTYNILAERERHPEKTLSEQYDPRKMSKNLKELHRNLDIAIEQCYRSSPFENDEERLEYLLNLYEEMSQREQQRKKHA